MQQPIYYILVVVIALFFVFVLDYFLTSKKLRELNNKISQNQNYLKDKDKRELCKIILNQTYMWGVFTLIEAKKLKKALDKF
mgnify:CR=1 FL=1